MKCVRCGHSVTQTVFAKSVPKEKQYTACLECTNCGFKVSATSSDRNEANRMLIAEWSKLK